MECPSCHHKLKRNYCTRCGIMIGKNNEIVSLREKEEDHSLEYFLGEDRYKFFQNNNFAAFFLGPLYFVYYKFYLLGISLGYLEILILYLLRNINPMILIFLKLISCLLYCCYTNEIYLFLVKKQVKKIGVITKEQFENKQKTSIVALALAVLLFEVSLFLIF